MHKFIDHLFICKNIDYGSMLLERAETRPRSNSCVESCFPKVQSAKLNTDETILMAGREYFGETAVKPRNHIPVNTMRKSHNHTIVLSDEEQGETAVFAGYMNNNFQFKILQSINNEL